MCILFLDENDSVKFLNHGRREIFQDTAPHLVDSICAYRAGYVAAVSTVFSLMLLF